MRAAVLGTLALALLSGTAAARRLGVATDAPRTTTDARGPLGGGALATSPADTAATSSASSGTQALVAVGGAAATGDRPDAVAAAASRCPAGAPVRQVRLADGVRKIAVTFDDGPWPADTVATMDTLARHGLEGKATFFMIGRNVVAHPELARLVLARGYTIGNHTVHHRYQPATIAGEVALANDLVEQATGVRPTYFRAPGLTKGAAIDDAMRATGMCDVFTTLTLGDTERPAATAETLVARMKEQTTPGAIIVLHTEGPRRDAARAALDEFLTWATAPDGGAFEIVGLDELMASGEATTDTHTHRARPRPRRSHERAAQREGSRGQASSTQIGS